MQRRALFVIAALACVAFCYAGCSGTTTYSASTGTFDDGSGSSNYNSNSDCTFIIAPSAPTAYIVMTFTSFALETNVDTVTVSQADGRSLGVYSGTISVPTIIAAGSTATIRFQTDSSVNRAGWTLTYNATNLLTANGYLSGNGGFAQGTATIGNMNYYLFYVDGSETTTAIKLATNTPGATLQAFVGNLGRLPTNTSYLATNSAPVTSGSTLQYTMLFSPLYTPNNYILGITGSGSINGTGYSLSVPVYWASTLTTGSITGIVVGSVGGTVSVVFIAIRFLRVCSRDTCCFCAILGCVAVFFHWLTKPCRKGCCRSHSTAPDITMVTVTSPPPDVVSPPAPEADASASSRSSMDSKQGTSVNEHLPAVSMDSQLPPEVRMGGMMPPPMYVPPQYATAPPAYPPYPVPFGQPPPPMHTYGGGEMLPPPPPPMPPAFSMEPMNAPPPPPMTGLEPPK